MYRLRRHALLLQQRNHHHQHLQHACSVVVNNPAAASSSSFHSSLSQQESKTAAAATTHNDEVSCRLHQLVRAYRNFGHVESSLDPLGLKTPEKGRTVELKPSVYQLNNVLQQEQQSGPSQALKFDIDGVCYVEGSKRYATLHEVIDHLERVYCGHIGAQFMHLETTREMNWIARRMENLQYESMSATEQKRHAKHMLESEVFDHFLGRKFPNLKRYGLEGTESMIPAVDVALRELNADGVQDVVIGMPHRGRLNLLTGLFNYPARALFHKIRGNCEFPEEMPGTGDVLSHLGVSTDVHYGKGKATGPVHVSMLNNSSHLEAVNPIALGKTRDKISQGRNAACVLLHGDAAFVGQGIVAESFVLSKLPNFHTNGTIHLIVNNQLGFTTAPENYRSSRYSGDIGKMVGAPIFSVNAESMEDVTRVMQLAVEYRQRFQKDVIVELVGYRRHGHNELDEASFTQPKMYKVIRQRQTFPVNYADALVEQQVLTKLEVDTILNERKAFLEQEFAAADTYVPEKHFYFNGKWAQVALAKDVSQFPTADTGITAQLLKEVALQSVTLPEGFVPHQRLEKYHISHRKEVAQLGLPLDWATAEAVAVGSLLKEGYRVRLSGEDVGRGTFSQRHFEIVDQETEQRAVPLKQLGDLDVAASPLSELAVLGFEYGVSLNDPRNLTIWEAQFGDFNNGAQVMIDNFISSGEDKWLLSSALTMLLPHGMDGVGPEHSQCRLERFLQLCDGDVNTDDLVHRRVNMQVINPTTPANYFHALRRQMHSKFRKPLVVVGPKVLLRHPKAISPVKDFMQGSSFQPVLSDNVVQPSKSIKRVIFCSGKVYYDLEEKRAQLNLEDKVAIVRIEELCPFPFERLEQEITRYTSVSGVKLDSFMWMQEEHENYAGYMYAAPRLQKLIERLPDTVIANKQLVYAGRKACSSSAVGVKKIHEREIKQMFEDAFRGL